MTVCLRDPLLVAILFSPLTYSLRRVDKSVPIQVCDGRALQAPGMASSTRGGINKRSPSWLRDLQVVLLRCRLNRLDKGSRSVHPKSTLLFGLSNPVTPNPKRSRGFLRIIDDAKVELGTICNAHAFPSNRETISEERTHLEHRIR